MRNYDMDPSKGAQPGEAAWMLSTAILASLGGYQGRHPDDTRGESMDRVHRELEMQRRRRLAISHANKSSLDDPKTKATKKSKKGPKKKADGGLDPGLTPDGPIGTSHKKSWDRIMAEPVLLEMLLATKSCLYPYDKILGVRQVDVILEPNSGAFAALYWLSVQTLLRVSPHEISRIPGGQLLKA